MTMWPNGANGFLRMPVIKFRSLSAVTVLLWNTLTKHGILIGGGFPEMTRAIALLMLICAFGLGLDATMPLAEQASENLLIILMMRLVLLNAVCVLLVGALVSLGSPIGPGFPDMIRPIGALGPSGALIGGLVETTELTGVMGL